METISFFSFKGGVGRTALLANLGALWASQGKVVLLIDMDLFAPGLTYSSLVGPPLDPENWQGGISNLFQSFFEGGISQETTHFNFIPPRQLIREMVLPKEGGGSAGGRLLLIDVGTRVNEVLSHGVSTRPDLDGGSLRPIPPQEKQDGEPKVQTVLRALARKIKEDLAGFRLPAGDPAAGKGIDYVLIDCRTGWPELLDLSLGYLADQMVVVSGLNGQNLQGLELTLEALKAEGRVALDHFPARLVVVFSPVPAAEDQATLDALDHGHEVIAAALRVTRANIREMAPQTDVIHYNPALAVSDELLALSRPRSLYFQEVKRIGAKLIAGSAGDEDELIKDVRSRTLKIVPLPGPSDQEESPKQDQDSPRSVEMVNAELPAWWWPLRSEAEAEVRLNELVPENRAISFDRGVLATMLCHSISLTIEEKQKILAAFARLTQRQVEEVVNLMETEQQTFLRMNAQQPRYLNEFFGLYFKHQSDWAGLILGGERAGLERFLRGPLEGNVLFPAWVESPEYWQLLARDLLTRLNDPQAAGLALEKAQALTSQEPEKAVIQFLNALPKEGEQPTLPEAAEELALSIAPDSARVRFRVAQSRWRRTGDAPWSRVLLDSFLESPPEDGDLCYEILAFVLNEAEPLAPHAEGLARAALERASNKAWAGNSLGNLLKDHLGRYAESEAAYRTAIEIDPKYAYPWNGLGILLKNHLGRYDESEAAYRKAIEIDPKLAYPWNGLGNLLQDNLGRYTEAEAAYRKAIEIGPKYPYPWNGLGLLMWERTLDHLEARKCFLRGLELQPDNEYLNMNLGHSLVISGQRSEGLAYLEKALEKFARLKDWPAVENTVWLAVELRNAERLAALRTTLKEAPTWLAQDLDFQAAMAFLELGLGEEAAAQTAWQRTLEVLTSHGDRRSYLWVIYAMAVARPDLWPVLATFARDLLDLPAERLAGFRDIAPPPDHLERFRPFAEGLVTEPDDPRNPLYQPPEGEGGGSAAFARLQRSSRGHE